jgi:hypothetical protein
MGNDSDLIRYGRWDTFLAGTFFGLLVGGGLVLLNMLASGAPWWLCGACRFCRG